MKNNVNLIITETGKIKGNLKKLWNLTKPEKIDRNEALNAVREIDKSIANIVKLFEILVVYKFGALDPSEQIKFDVIARMFGKTGFSQVISDMVSYVRTYWVPIGLSSLISSNHLKETPSVRVGRN
jgi:hypothetical protein